jgi:hypothetical protein
MVDTYKHSNEALGSIKGREFLDQMKDYRLLNKYSPAWNEFS